MIIIPCQQMDVYSYGVLLCEMYLGTMPEPERREERVAQVTNQVLRDLIKRCIETVPAARPTMEEIIDHVQDSKHQILCPQEKVPLQKAEEEL